MKGNPEEPRCSFSRKIAGILQTDGVTFGHVDILEDEEVAHLPAGSQNVPELAHLPAALRKVKADRRS